MTSPLSARLISRASNQVLKDNVSCSAVYSIRRRRFANVADAMTLPLKGYKVLDMTRVLAGVSLSTFFQAVYILTRVYSHIAHKYWET